MKIRLKTSFFVLLLGFLMVLSGMINAQADLKISIRCPGKAKSGQDLGTSIKVFVTNAGNKPAYKFSVDLILSKDMKAPVKFAVFSPNFKEDCLLLGGREYVNVLYPGKTVAVKLNGKNRIPADTLSRIYYLGAVVDPGNKVRERNERNNTTFCKIQIYGKKSSSPKPCKISLSRLSKYSGFAGDIFYMYGTWGPSQGIKIPCINKGGMNKLIVLKWTNTSLKVKIPNNLPVGKYKVGVYCNPLSMGKTYGTTWKDFTIKSKIAIIKPIRPGLRVIKPILQGCPDPAAVSVNFKLLRKLTQFIGRIRITGWVKNIGNKDFRSLPGQKQASVQLFEGIPGGSFRLKANIPFANLAKGAMISVTYDRDWNISSPSEGEFPPSYRVIIVYDPDIRMDSSKDNDDCNNKNNKKERSGADIRTLF